MEFSYKAYYRVNFVVPLVVVIAFSVFLLISVASLFGEIKRQQLTKKVIVSSLMATAICIFCITLNVRTLARGGIYLCFEKETDAIITHGIINRIEECDIYDNQKYGTGEGMGVGTNFGVKIIVEGNCYNAITNGSLQPGDDVIITYLPRSRFVLKISRSP